MHLLCKLQVYTAGVDASHVVLVSKLAIHWNLEGGHVGLIHSLIPDISYLFNLLLGSLIGLGLGTKLCLQSLCVGTLDSCCYYCLGEEGWTSVTAEYKINHPPLHPFSSIVQLSQISAVSL